MINNPFIFKRPLKPDEFVNREDQINIGLRCLNNSEPSVVIGDPHIGKTSFLKYLLNIVKDDKNFSNTIFSFIDTQMIGSEFTLSQFWKEAFAPLKKYVHDQLSFLYEIFELVEKNNYGNFVLEKLFLKLENHDWRYMLFIDELDFLFTHKVLNSAEFWGGLRSLSSRLDSFNIMCASRKTIIQMNQLTAEISAGSPFFNTFMRIPLYNLTEDNSNILIKRSENTFFKHDYNFIKEISGGHPYLLQTASSKLWDFYNINIDINNYSNIYEKVGREIFNELESHFLDTWNNWDNAFRKVITIIALEQLSDAQLSHHFSIERLAETPQDFLSERQKLLDSGIIKKNGSNNYVVTSKAFLWWLADEIKRNVRDESEFKNWLQINEIDWVITRGNKKKLIKFVNKLLDVVGKGSMTLIQSFAKAMGEEVGKNIH